MFLYQGALQSDRGGLFDLITLLCEARTDDIIAVMGRQNSVTDALARKYTNFSQVPFVRPPHHLEVTSYADVGLAYYQGGSMWGLSPSNAVYCAPNKIFEYTGYGIPMLCNDIPGLRYSVGASGAAVCLDVIDADHVKGATDDLIDNYDRYSMNATSYFDSIDIVEIVKEILEFARRES